MATSSKLLIMAASGLGVIVAAYILVAAWLNFFPFAEPPTEDAQTVEPLVDVPTSNLEQDTGPGTGVNASPTPTTVPTSPAAPQIPPTTDPGSSGGGGGQPTPVPLDPDGEGRDGQTGPTPTTEIPAIEVEEITPTQIPTSPPPTTPSPTDTPGGGGGGSPTDTDDDGERFPFNRVPIALNDTATVDEGGAVFIDVLSNDSDPDGDLLSVIGVTQGINGTVTFGASGLTYTHNGTQTGSDSFNYFNADPLFGTATGTVTITVNILNDPPIAVDDSFSTDEETPLSGNVLSDNGVGPDSDEEGDTLTVNATPVALPTDGILTLNTDGTFSYSPNLNFNGTDSFEYLLEASNGGTDQGTVTITVNSVNDLPVAQDDSFVTDEDVPLLGDVLADIG